jgi:hypothetical protein
MIPSFETLRWLIHEATAGEKPSRIYHLPPLNSIVLEGADREVPHSSEDIRDKDTERGGAGILKFYADVHKTKKNGEGFRITYTTDGTTFKHVDSFSEIPAGPGDKLFMDTLPPQHTDGAIELLRKGVEVNYLKRFTLIEKARRELRLPKNARGDIRALMSVEEGVLGGLLKIS